MTSEDVLAVLERLEAAGVTVWLDGGWGVDALLGRRTRSHADLDLAAGVGDLERLRAALAPLGYEHAAEVEPGLPGRFVLRERNGRQVDVHPLRFDEEGNGVQDLGGGRTGTYPAAGLAGRGSIGCRTVRCLTPELHLAFHAGYEPVARHRRDVALLVARLAGR
jgi:lincosamide nucleotidyltransferase A/C/D/E